MDTSFVSDAVSQLKTAYLPLLSDQVPTAEEEGEIDRAIAVVVKAGVGAIVNPLTSAVPTADDGGELAAAYAVLANIAVAHMERGQLDAQALIAKVADTAIAVLTKLATGAIAAALAAA